VLGVLQGFATISVVVLAGMLLAHFRVLDEQAQQVLATVAFFVASPALLLVVLSRAPLAAVFSRHLLVAAGSSAAMMAVAVVLARRCWRLPRSETMLAGLSAGYVNAANLGIPVALYVLGDATFAAPIMLLQLLVVTPLALAVLDADLPGARRGPGARIRAVFGNPVTIGALLGLVISLARIRLPDVVLAPVTLLANLAVPAMLLAFGVSLRLGRRPGPGGGRIAALVSLKLAGQPVTATALGAVLGMRGHDLFAAAVMAALPTAQNVFTYAMRYQRGVLLVRDAILVSTLLSLPAVMVVALLLAPR